MTFLRCRLRLHRWCPGSWWDDQTPAGITPAVYRCSCRCHR